MFFAEAFEVAPHVPAPDRLHVERRILDAEQLGEDRPEEERLVLQFHTGARTLVRDAESGDVAIRGGEIEPELHRRER